MKIIYNPTRVISTADLFDTCDPPIEFAVRTKIGAEWNDRQIRWDEAGAQDVDEAMALVADVFVTVAQGDDQWPLKGIDGVKELRDAVEEANPGAGDEFICGLVSGFSLNHWGWLRRNRGKSLILLEPSNNGVKEKAQKVPS